METTVRLNQRTIDRIYGLSGPQGMAWFIRKALAQALDGGEVEWAAMDARRRDKKGRAGGQHWPSPSPGDHPPDRR